MEGALLLDKPAGLSSASAVDEVKRLLRVKKAGHTGTLDPSATGLLIILLGRATRFTPFLQSLPKEYLFTVSFTGQTDTWDAEGKLVYASDAPLSCSKLKELLPKLTGRRLQTPPPFSAKKVKGRRAYELARKGKEVKLKPVEVEVRRLELLSCNEREREARFLTELSSGGYVRSLAWEMGRLLGTGGFVKELRRTAVGPIKVDGAVTLEELKSADRPERFVLPVEELLSFMPAVEVSKEELRKLVCGAPVEREAPEGWVRLFAGGRFFGVGRSEGSKVYPKRLLVQNDLQT
ncbi:MAG: tRNA pseudouridine(55) synthase TruB [Aquificae bacterium]|nr:tRNA pseudouridine(55) synthase TruB [Aquificota bacterium]